MGYISSKFLDLANQVPLSDRQHRGSDLDRFAVSPYPNCLSSSSIAAIIRAILQSSDLVLSGLLFARARASEEAVSSHQPFES